MGEPDKRERRLIPIKKGEYARCLCEQDGSKTCATWPKKGEQPKLINLFLFLQTTPTSLLKRLPYDGLHHQITIRKRNKRSLSLKKKKKSLISKKKKKKKKKKS